VTTDLKYLVFTAMLTAILWIPYVVCQVRTNGPLQPTNYTDPTMPRPILHGDCVRIAPTSMRSRFLLPSRPLL